MISKAAILERANEWHLTADVVEKDYVLGWLLAGIALGTELGTTWVFKGGTCLKKCILETYRFSEDLDFTLLRDGRVPGISCYTGTSKPRMGLPPTTFALTRWPRSGIFV